MKETAPKKTWFQTLRTLCVPLAIGGVTVAALAVVVGMVWKDYRTAMMDSLTKPERSTEYRQELVERLEIIKYGSLRPDCLKNPA